MLPPAPIGFTGVYFGSQLTPPSSTTRNYWVQAIYPHGRSLIAGPLAVKAGVGLSSANVVLLTWAPMPGAIGYDVLESAAATLPQGNAALALATNLQQNSFTDVGNAPASYTVTYGGDLRVAYTRYDFAVDGGGATIIPSVADVIPANALIVGGTANSPTAVTAAGAATIALGFTAGAGAAALLAATGKASFSIDANQNLLATFAAPIKMSAAGQVQLTVATGPLTAGVVEVTLFYTVASSA